MRSKKRDISPDNGHNTSQDNWPVPNSNPDHGKTNSLNHINDSGLNLINSSVYY